MAVWSTTRVIEITENRRIDSEFFHPVYLSTEEVVNSYETIQTLGKLGQFLIGPFGSAFHVNNYDPNSKYRYVRGKDVKPFSLKDDDNVYMPEKDYKRLIKYALAKDDLLISVVGTLGNVAIVPEGFEGIFSCKSTVFRNSKVDPYYLLAYFNSKYGRLCLLRRQRGAVQTGLNKEDLKTVPVPLVKETVQKEIGEKIRRSLQLSQQSKSLYSQATQLLDEALGLNNIQFKKEKSYKASFSEVTLSQRLDANHFKPKFSQLLHHIINEFDCIHVGTSVFVNRRGVQPVYCSEGVIKVITSQHITSTHLDYDKFEKTTEIDFLKHPEAHIKQGDILTYTTGAYVGQTNVYLSAEPVLASNHVNIIRLKDNDIDPVYVAFVMNSLLGKLQTEKHIRGSAQAELYPKDIAKFIIPILPANEMSAISECVRESLIAVRKSKDLLEQAKNEVETLIEQAANQS